jgi:ABC-type branched-subunit amino acid transport system substrate-binding protein
VPAEEAISGERADPVAASPRVARGKAIYLTGISPSGHPIRAQLAGGGADVPAAVLTCGNCHGRDGIGRAEGGILPATITWDELTKDYSPTHPSGRQRPAYDEPSVRKAITMGRDPAGRMLDDSMPRYLLTREDLDDLLAYLKELGRDSDPGITDQRLIVGTILAPASSLGAMNRAVKSVLSAFFQEVNDGGGIYGRRVELRCLEAPESARDRADAARRFLMRQETFALIAPFLAGSEETLTVAAEEEKVPILGPFTLDWRSGWPLNRYVFHLNSGLTDQARALAVFIGERLTGRRPTAAILFSASEAASREAAEEARGEFRRLGWGSVKLRPISPGAAARKSVDRLRTDAVEVVLILSHDGQEVKDLLDASSRGWHPLLLVPGGLAGKEALNSLSRAGDRLFLAFPTMPQDVTREGKAEYERLVAAHGLPGQQRSSQIAALAAAKVFVEAMTSVGRAASREKLIEQLEHLYQKPTGLTRPISFAPNRRFGTRGAYIVGIDPEQAKLVPVTGFIELPRD